MLTTVQESKSAPKPKPVLSPLFKKPKQSERNSPKYLTERQVEELIQTAYKNGQKKLRKRNALILFMLFRHGLRRNELIGLKWTQVNFMDAQIHIYRLKNSKFCMHPIKERELRMLNEYKKIAPSSSYIFTDVNAIPLSPSGLRKMIDTIALKSSIPYRIHPHMFRHGCGYYLANNGVELRAIQDYLGHKDITKTAIYTAMAPNRFSSFWED